MKFWTKQNFIPIEKFCSALIFALTHFNFKLFYLFTHVHETTAPATHMSIVGKLNQRYFFTYNYIP